MNNFEQVLKEIDRKEIAPGYFTAVQSLKAGRGRIVVVAQGEILQSWQYASITEALAAWFAWNPASGEEPAGCERRVAAS